MELLYASLLLHKAGKPVTEEALQGVLNSAGIQSDPAKIKATVAALKDLDIDKVIKETAIAAPAQAAPSAEAGKAREGAAKKEEKAAEGKAEEEAAAGLGALFG